MALVGYYAGFNEQRAADENIAASQARRALAEQQQQENIRRFESGQNMEQQRAQAATQQDFQRQLAVARGSLPQLSTTGTTTAESDSALMRQLGKTGRVPSHPLENYLGGVKDQESYRPAMMQYVASGGKRPQWFTGNFENDQPNIEAAISATMTPQQQMQRRDIQVKQEDLKESKEARIQVSKDAASAREREVAAKQEGLKQKAATVTREDKLTAHSVLGGVLGADYAKTDMNMLNAVAARVAAGAKKMLNTDESGDANIEELMQEEIDNMIQRGELKMPEKGTFLGRMTQGIIGADSSGAEFNRKGTEQPAAPVSAPISTPSAPVSLKSKADYDSLPKGALYVHPSDGKTYRKK